MYLQTPLLPLSHSFVWPVSEVPHHAICITKNINVKTKHPAGYSASTGYPVGHPNLAQSFNRIRPKPLAGATGILYIWMFFSANQKNLLWIESSLYGSGKQRQIEMVVAPQRQGTKHSKSFTRNKMSTNNTLASLSFSIS